MRSVNPASTCNLSPDLGIWRMLHSLPAFPDHQDRDPWGAVAAAIAHDVRDLLLLLLLAGLADLMVSHLLPPAEGLCLIYI